MNINSCLVKNCVSGANDDKDIVLKIGKGKTFERILDCGCDVGDFTSKFAKLVHAKEVHGVEIYQKAANKARSKGIKIVEQDLNQPLPYKDNYFDCILSMQNIEHLYFTDDWLKEMQRILKPNGTLIITTTNFAAIHYRILLLIGIQPICMHPSEYQTFPLRGRNPRYGHKSLFTYHALKEVLQKHNFKVSMSYTHTIYFLPKFVARALCYIFPSFGTFSGYVCRKK